MVEVKSMTSKKGHQNYRRKKTLTTGCVVRFATYFRNCTWDLEQICVGRGLCSLVMLFHIEVQGQGHVSSVLTKRERAMPTEQYDILWKVSTSLRHHMYELTVTLNSPFLAHPVHQWKRVAFCRLHFIDYSLNLHKTHGSICRWSV